MRKNKSVTEIKVKGFVRTQIVDALTGEVLGDSGFVQNTVVNTGFQDYVIGSIGAIAGSKQVSYMLLGTGTAPGAADTSLQGETGGRVTTQNSVISSKTLQCTAQFAGSSMGGTCTIQNVALANTSSGGSILCGTTFATSQWASNQNVLLLKRLRQLSVRIIRKLREFGEQLCDITKSIPSRAKNLFLEGVTTMHEALAFAR